MAKPKAKDFEKQKLRVGKLGAQRANQTDVSFRSRAIVLRNQHKGPNVSAYIALTRHHQAPQRRQAVANLIDLVHQLRPGTIVEAVSPLLVDEDPQVRRAAVSGLRVLGEFNRDGLAAYVANILLYTHAAMTHISASVRADSTKALDVVVEMCPFEVARQGFARSLSLFFPLLGWSQESAVRQTRSATVTTTLSFGKLAAKTRGIHLQSLSNLVALGLQQDAESTDVTWHPDSLLFLVPQVSSPFAPGLTEDRDARIEALGAVYDALLSGLEDTVKEGGEAGRIASRIAKSVTAAM